MKRLTSMHSRSVHLILAGAMFVSAAAFLAPLAQAHHGWSEYDQNKAFKITAKVIESGYEHPHGFVRVSADGKTWLAVLAPPFRMENRGLTKSMIASGATITLEGYPHRSKGDEMRAERISADGKTVELR